MNLNFSLTILNLNVHFLNNMNLTNEIRIYRKPCNQIALQKFLFDWSLRLDDFDDMRERRRRLCGCHNKTPVNHEKQSVEGLCIRSLLLLLCVEASFAAIDRAQ